MIRTTALLALATAASARELTLIGTIDIDGKHRNAVLFWCYFNVLCLPTPPPILSGSSQADPTNNIFACFPLAQFTTTTHPPFSFVVRATSSPIPPLLFPISFPPFTAQTSKSKPALVSSRG